MNLEDEMNKTLKNLGLREWVVVWSPDPSQDAMGKVLYDKRTILIFAVNPDDVFETLKHEVIEIIMEPVLSKYRILSNKMIEAHEKSIYAEKERAFERLAPFIFEKTFEEILRKIKEDKES